MEKKMEATIVGGLCSWGLGVQAFSSAWPNLSG